MSLIFLSDLHFDEWQMGFHGGKRHNVNSIGPFRSEETPVKLTWPSAMGNFVSDVLLTSGMPGPNEQFLLFTC